MRDFNFALNEFLFDDLTNAACRLFDLRKAFDNSEGIEDEFLTFDDYVVMLDHLKTIVDLTLKNAFICQDKLQTDLKRSREASSSEEE